MNEILSELQLGTKLDLYAVFMKHKETLSRYMIDFAHEISQDPGFKQWMSFQIERSNLRHGSGGDEVLAEYEETL